MKSLIGRKIGMTILFEKERVVPVTLIQAGPCFVLDLKDEKRDGYKAVQLGFEEAKEKELPKPQLGICKKAGVPPVKIIKEFRVEELPDLAVGTQVTADIFKSGDTIRVSAVSKGKGFQGVMKRWGFAGGGASHGSMAHRKPGAIGCRTTPGKIFKGKRMAGHMGMEKVTVRNLKVVQVQPERNLIFVQGSVPGARGSLVLIREESK
jgi:large subunit ribosomal protein L3